MLSAVYTIGRDNRLIAADDTFPVLREAAAQNANVFDVFPGVAEAGLAGIIDRAWRDGIASRVIEYGGAISWVSISRTPDGNPDTLLVSVTLLPLEGLLEAVTAACEAGQPVAA